MFNYFRFCNLCGISLGSIDLYCYLCWERILSYKFPTCLNWHKKFFLYYLFEWSNKNSYFMHNLVYSLKGGKLLESFDFLSFHYLKNYFYFIKNNQKVMNNIILVPACRSGNYEENHALIFAKSLAGMLNIPVYDCLYCKEKSSVQKVKRISERKKITFFLKEDYCFSLFESKNIIFIDDVFTTGSTALAAYKVLHKAGKNNFEVWTLFRKLKNNEQIYNEQIYN